MKRRFTILIAALALLVSLAIPMGMRGQTSDVQELTNANIVAAGAASTSYASWSITDGNNHTWNAYAIKNKHSNATSSYHFLQIKKYASNTAYYIQVPELGTKITSITMTVSGSSQPMTGGGNSATLYFSNSNSTSATGTGVASGTGASSVTIDCSGLNLNTGYITASGAVRIWDVSVTYTSSGTPTPTMSVSTNSIDFGSNAINPANPYTQTFEVTFANLTENLTVTSFGGVTVSPASINYNATSPQTVTVSYNPTAAGSISGNISVNSSEVNEALVAVTGSAYDPADVVTYERYTGALVEGDYIICANAEVAMKNVISGSRFENEAVTVTNNAITNPDASIIWHIAPDGDYWTIYNAAVNKYAAGTNSNNQGTLLDAVTDNARWNITYQYSNYTVICYGRNSSNNKYLRRNGDYGWATYANSTGQVPTFYKKVVTNQVAMPEFSLAAGTYYETKSVTLSCSTDGATIYYTTDGTTPSASNGTEYTTAISVSSTMTIKAIAVKEGMANSDVATAQYTIELPLSTMEQIFAKATEVGNTATDVRIAFDNWVVTGANNSSHTFVTDGTKGFMIYQSNHGFAAGDILSGTVQCRVQLYNGAAEITNLTSSTTGLTVTTGGNVTIADIDMADLAAINTGALVSYENLTCSITTSGSYTNYYLTDGTTQIQAYSTLYSGLANSLEDGKTYNITGVFVQNNSTKRVNPRSAADIEEVQVQHNEYTLTVGNLVHVTTYVFDASDQSEALLIGAGQVDIYDGTEVMISLVVDEGYVIESLIVGGVDVTSQIDADAYTFTMPTNAVTVTATAVEDVPPTPGNWVLTSIEDLTEDDIFVIVGDNGDTYAMSNNNGASNPPAAVEVIVAEGTLSAEPAANLQWNISITDDGYTFYPSGETETWLYCTNANNGVRVGTNDNKVFTIEDGYLKNVATSRYVGIYNSQDWRCYTSHVSSGNQQNNIEGQTFAFYKKVVEPTPVTFTKTITAYTSNDNGWYLIASPIGQVTPGNVTNMIAEPAANYDLFIFDQTNESEWQNYKQNHFTTLEPGTGYLYANSGDVTLTFTGSAYTSDGTFPLVYSKENPDAFMHGWNLMGNPYAESASVNRPYYTLNGDFEYELAEEDESVEAMEGIFVHVTEAEYNANQYVTFTPVSQQQQGGSKGSSLTLNLNKGGKLLDRAIISFSQGHTLPKFQFDRNHTKVYIPQEGQDYAIVRGEEMGEMPVNFKAENDGTYSLSFSSRNAEFAYLHLIDNMTGADVDLLQTQSYSFEARTTDYESRFKLVFATGDNSKDDNFAFFSNGSFVINNEGNATLQVIDVTGRIISSESVNGCTNVSVNAAPGVYMLRLVNGDNVKVQKVVVK